MGRIAGEVDRRELLAVAVDVAAHAADLAASIRAGGLSAADVGTKSTATDLVTAADRAVERLMVDRLRRARPDDALLGEEYGAQASAPTEGAVRSRVRWVVDPIDGTVNYVYGLPYYAVSVAAEVDGVAVVGVVRDVVSGAQWTAIRGEGAWREGKRLACSTVRDLDQALVATGFGYDAGRRAHQGKVIAALLPVVRDIRRLGAASLDLCFAAEGRVDAYFEKGLAAWDHAAGGLIAAEAGLVVTGLRGSRPGPDMVLAAPEAFCGRLHDLLVALDADLGP